MLGLNYAEHEKINILMASLVYCFQHSHIRGFIETSFVELQGNRGI
jgi:hypothetical protein